MSPDPLKSYVETTFRRYSGKVGIERSLQFSSFSPSTLFCFAWALLRLLPLYQFARPGAAMAILSSAPPSETAARCRSLGAAAAAAASVWLLQVCITLVSRIFRASWSFGFAFCVSRVSPWLNLVIDGRLGDGHGLEPEFWLFSIFLIGGWCCRRLSFVVWSFSVFVEVFRWLAGIWFCGLFVYTLR